MIDFIIIALATWRVTSMFVEEDGPWFLFVHIRNFDFKVLECVWCFSLWVGLFFTVLWAFLPEITTWIAMPFALSTAAILIDKHLEGG